MENIKEFSENKINSLAENPDNIVYKYVDREPLKPQDILQLETVQDYIKELWLEVQMVRTDKLKCTTDLNSLQAKKLVWWLKTKSQHAKRWILFSDTHPLIFDRCVARNTTNEEIKALLYMIYLKKQENNHQIQNGQQHLQEYLMNTFAMSEEESVKRYGSDVQVIDLPTR
jgi:hypothetical protein